MASTQKMASPFLIDVLLEDADPIGSAVALVLADAELLSELVFGVITIAFVPRVDVEVLPKMVTSEVMIALGVKVVPTAEGNAVARRVDVALGIVKGALSDKIAIGTSVFIRVVPSVNFEE